MIVEHLTEEEKEILNYLLKQQRVEAKSVFMILLPHIKRLSKFMSKKLIVNAIKEDINYEFNYKYFTTLYKKHIENKSSSPKKPKESKEDIAPSQQPQPKEQKQNDTPIAVQPQEKESKSIISPSQPQDVQKSSQAQTENLPQGAKNPIPQSVIFKEIVERGLFDENIDYYVYHDLEEIDFGRFKEAKIDTKRLLVYTLEKYYIENQVLHFDKWNWDGKTNRHYWYKDELLMKEREFVIKYLVQKYILRWNEDYKKRRMYMNFDVTSKYREDTFLLQCYHIPIVDIFSRDDVKRCYQYDPELLYGDSWYKRNLDKKPKHYERFIEEKR